MSQAPTIAHRGIMLVVSSPSGAGKTTLTRNLIKEEDDISLSISVTTRARRASEIEGVHYQFITQRRFEQMRDAGDLLEWAQVHGNYYGTPREPVERALSKGQDVLFDIDWQGTQQLYKQVRADVVSVFVLPPSAAELQARLERRAEDKSEIIIGRLRSAIDEIAHWAEYDYVLINRDLDKSFLRLRAILNASRLKRSVPADMQKFVDSLIADLKTMTG
jgi:guanylate kinase